MLTSLCLLLLLIAAVAAETVVVSPSTTGQSHSQPASASTTVDGSASTLPDWALYLLTIAAIGTGFHFVRSLWTSPQDQQFKPESLSSRRPAAPAAASSSMSAPAAAADPNKAWTLAELSAYNGTDASKPLLMGCGGKVFDVSSARGFYGPGAAYGVFAGKDASRGLGRMEIEYTGADISDLSGTQQVTLHDVRHTGQTHSIWQ